MLALGKTRDPTGKPVKQPHDPSLAETCVKIETDIKQTEKAYLMTNMSPWRHSLTSRIKKSTLGPPMPMHTTDTGTPLYRPVIVRKPRSEYNENGLGDASKYVAMCSAREIAPTVT